MTLGLYETEWFTAKTVPPLLPLVLPPEVAGLYRRRFDGGACKAIEEIWEASG